MVYYKHYLKCRNYNFISYFKLSKEQEKIQAERKALEEAREKERLEKQKLKNSPEYKKRRADRNAR